MTESALASCGGFGTGQGPHSVTGVDAIAPRRIPSLMNHSPENASSVADGAAPQNSHDSQDSPERFNETAISSELSVRFMQSLRDLWVYRDLFTAFVARDVKVRYKQTALGVIWVLLQPLLGGVIFAVLFRSIGAKHTAGWYSDLLFFMAGLVPWTSFSSAVQNAATSMETNAGMISKIYFPRMVIPGAYVCGAMLDFFIAFVVVLGMGAFGGALSPMLIVLVPALILIQMAAAMGIGLIFGALNAQYHDVKYVVPFVLQMGLFVTIPQALAKWPAAAQPILSLNPMAGVIEAYRALITGGAVNYPLLGEAALISFVLLIGGIWFFRARESKLVDIL